MAGGNAATLMVEVVPQIDTSGAISAIEKALTNLTTKEHVIRIKVDPGNSIKDIGNIADKLASATGKKAGAYAKEQEKQARSAASASKATSKYINSATDGTKRLVKGTEAYDDALVSVQKKISELSKLEKKYADAGRPDAKSLQAYNDIISARQRLEKLEQTLLKPQAGGKIANATANSVNRELERVDKAVEKSSATIARYGEDTNAVTKKVAKEQADAAKQQAAMVQQQERAAAKEQEKQARAAAKEQEKLDKIEKKNNTLLKDDPAAEWKAQKQIMSERLRIEQELQNWTAAKSGRTSDDYKTLAASAEKLAQLDHELSRGVVTNGEYAKRMREIGRETAAAELNIVSAGKNTLSIGDQLKKAFSNVSRFITPAMVFRQAIQTVKQMASASMEVESAMNRIQIITGASDSQMGQFFETATTQAKDLGKSITEVAGSIETFARLGYNLKEAENLSRYATIMSNVGDVSVDEATTGITSIIKGYQMLPDQAEHVSDVLIKVGQEYAISAGELMEAFTRGGAALHASGTSFEQSAALFAATNASLQNASTTGTLWKTVSARIRGAKTELEELGEDTGDLAQGFSKYRDEILALTGFDIQDATGNYKNMYDIFVGLAQVWDKINGDPAKARVAEILGGTRQLSGIMSTITNIKDAMGAYEGAMESAGTAAQANDKYMETTAAHVGQFKASFQELSSDLMSSDMMTGFADAGSGALSAIDGLINKFGTLSTVLGTISFASIIRGLSQVGAFGGDIGNLASGFKTLFSSGAGTMLGGVGIATGVISAAIGIYTAYQNYLKELRQNADSATSSFDEMESSLTSSMDRVRELRSELDSGTLTDQQAYEAKKELLDIQNQLAESYPAIADGINLVNGSMEQQLALTDSIVQQQAQEAITENLKAYEEAKEYMETPVGPFGRGEYFGKLLETNSDEARQVLGILDDYKDTIKTVQDQDGSLNLYIEGDPREAHDALVEFADAVRQVRDSVEESGGTTTIFDEILRGAESELQLLNKGLDEFEVRARDYERLKLDADTANYGLPDSNDQRTAQRWLQDYTKAINDYKDALASGDTDSIKDAESAFSGINDTISAMTAPGGPMSQYKELFDEIKNTLPSMLIAQEDLKSALLGESQTSSGAGGDTTKPNTTAGAIQQIASMVKDRVAEQAADRINTLGEELKGANLSATEFLSTYADVLGGASIRGKSTASNIRDIVQAAYDLGAISDTGADCAQMLADILVDLGIIAADTASDIEQAAFSIEDFSSYQSTLTSALNSSRSATGLTTEEVEQLTEAYKDLDSFDPARLFENTLGGIHLNTDELRRLNEEVEQNKLTELAKQLSDQYQQYNDLRSQGADTSAIESEISATQQLISQYSALASAYNAWLTAKSGGNERDTYEGVGAGYDEMQKILDAGWYGDESLNAYLDLLLNPSARTGDAVEDWGKLTQAIADTGHSIRDYWSYDENGTLVSDGLFTFLDDVNHVFGDAYSTVRDGYNVWDFTGDKLNEVAEAFGMSTEAIQMMEKALVDTGAAVIFDDTNLDIMTGSLKNLNEKTGILDSVGIKLDYNLEEMSSKEIQSLIKDLDGKTAKIDIEAEGGEDAIAMLEALKYQLDQEYYIKLNSETGGALDLAAQKIERVKQLITEANGKGINIETFVEGDSQVQQIATEISNLPESVQIAVGVTTENLNNPAGIAQQFAAGSINVPVNFKVNADDPPEYENQNPQVVYDLKTPREPHFRNQTPTISYQMKVPPTPNPPNIERTITYRTVMSGGVFGVGGGGGHSTQATGTMTSVGRMAYANGSISLDRDEKALVNELGTESIIRNGQWMLIPGGMHQEDLKKGDIILSAKQTKALIETGRASGRGRAYADGTLLSSAYTTGSAARRRQNYSSIPSATFTSGNRGNAGKASSHSTSSKDKDKEDAPEIFDWIELAIDRIERLIKNLGITAESTFQKLATRMSATNDEIVTVAEEIKLQEKAYKRYVQEANAVGLNADLAKRVREGAIDIKEYDKDTQELIKDYQEWYEKALDCSDAIVQLNEDLGDLYESRFSTTQEDFENQIALLEHMTTTFENGMDEIEERGYLATTKYYEAMRNVANKNLAVQKKELKELTLRMSEAINSGAIKEGSAAWYEMQQEINGVKEAIQETEIEIIKLGNSIREVGWERFEYLQDRISQINDEAEFLINLMGHSNLHNDNGTFTSTGMATLGLHAESYNVYMNQADRYAKKIAEINKDIAKDPNNTKLLEQRYEWVELQRESILNAEEEKEAMISLVEDGVQLELKFLNDLINKYKESIDKSKSLYDYQKKVQEQTKNIASIQKQLAAYSGDTSEESKTRIQKLNVDLTEAMEKLQDTQWDRQISDQKQMLNELYSSYELILNQRLDNVDALLSDLITMVNLNSGASKASMNELIAAEGGYISVIDGKINHVTNVNQEGMASINSMIGSVDANGQAGFTSIKDTLMQEGKSVGYTLSDEMKKVWSSGGAGNAVVAMYGDLLKSRMDTTNSSLTTINSVINGIATNVAKMAGVSDAKANATVKATTSTTKTNKSAKPATKTTTPTTKKTTTKTATTAAKKTTTAAKKDKYDAKTKYGVALAIWNGNYGWGAGTTRKTNLEKKGFNYDEIQAIVTKLGKEGKIRSGAWVGAYYGIRDLAPYHINKFEHGGLVDYTGLAQVDGTPGKPEAFLNAEDTKNFMALKDALKDIVDGKITLFGDSSSNRPGYIGNIGASALHGVKPTSIGDITYQINIPIDHVSDYNDLVTKMKNDGKFEQMIQSMTIGRLSGQNNLAKNKYRW